VVAGRTNFVAFPKEYMLHLTTQVGHFLTVKLLGNLFEELDLFENLVQFVGFFLLNFVFALMNDFDDFFHLIELAQV
jgi:hypothetical protein